MNQALMFQPMGALVALTFLVLCFVPLRRFHAAFTGSMNLTSDLKFGESANVPAQVSIPNRNFMNLLELPLLFYVLCLALYVSNRVTELQLHLAWAYVALRALHSLIHLNEREVANLII